MKCTPRVVCRSRGCSASRLPIGSPGRSKQPITELVIRIGAPNRLDVPAYIEGVNIALTVAEKFDAPAIFDEQTGARWVRQEWRRSVYIGQLGTHPTAMISEHNPPLLGLTGAIEHVPFERGCHTRGMRKFGLPDLVLEDYVPRVPRHNVFEMVANLLVAGRCPHEQTGDLVIRDDDLAIRSAIHGAQIDVLEQ
jgi:hypothetical protein